MAAYGGEGIEEQGPPRQAGGDAEAPNLTPGSASHDRFVRDVEERERYLRGVLAAPFDNMVRWWRLYLADVEDHRGPDEDWRAAVHVPHAYSGVEARVGALMDILNSSDPPIQCGPVGDDDREVAMGAEQMLTTTLDVNSWRYKMDTILRERCVQGTSLFRLAWRSEFMDVNVTPLPTDVHAYASKMAICVSEAMKLGLPAPPAPDEMEQFNAWMREAEEAGVPVPMNPYEESIRTRTFNAPKMERLSIFDCRYDPQVEFIQEQPLFLIRTMRTEKWLKQHTGPGKMFDAEAVKMGVAARGSESSKFASQDKEIANVLSISSTGNVGVDPYYRNAHEVWECFFPGDEFAYVIILNRKVVINTDFRMPYGHGQIPIMHMRNTPVGGYFHGISEIQQPERLYYELNAHRNLLLDAVTLQTIPIFAKVNAFGLPITQFAIKPGAMWDLPRADAIAPVTKAMPLQDSWQIFNSLKQDIDETNSTPSQLRGGPATVGRVSATESERRFSQALARIKQDAMRIEEEMVPFAKQGLYLWYQFTSQDEREARGIAAGVANEDILRTLDWDIRFRGPTRSLNRDMLVQQEMTFANTFGGLLPPHRSMLLARRIYEDMGLKNADLILPPSDIKLAEENWARQQATQQGPPPGEGGAPPPGGPPPPQPGEVPLAGMPPAEAPAPEDVEGGAMLPGPGEMV